MKYKFYVYKVIGEAEITTENIPNKEEAIELVMKNTQHLNYKRPEYFYILLDKKPEVVK